MLELTEEQVERLRQREHADFVARLKTALVEKFPELAADDTLQPRLRVAHDWALRMGFESAEARTQLLFQEAFAPGFYEAPAIAAWLTKPGAPIEQRWADLMALADARIQGR